MSNTEINRERKICKVTYVGSIVNIVLIIFKFIAGFMGRSSAMMADAIHSVSDFITDIIVVAFVRVSGKPSDENHDYGHGKFETLATIIIGIVLLLVGVGIAYNGVIAILSVIKGAILPSPGIVALLGAVISIISKEVLFRYTVVQGRKLKSDAVVANAWHHRSDAFSSIATAIGITGAIVLGNKWTVLDPLAGVFVSFFIIKTAIGLIKPSIDELMEQSLPQSTEKDIEKLIESCDGVTSIRDLRTRKIGDYCAIECSVCMNGNIILEEAHTLITQIENQLRVKYGNKSYIIIHAEPSYIESL